MLELRRPELGRQLLERALLRVLVGAPADEAGAVAEAPTGDLVVADLDDQHGFQRLPLAGSLGVPAARAARSASGEAGRLDQSFEVLGEPRAFGCRHGGGETDVIQQALLVIEA